MNAFFHRRGDALEPTASASLDTPAGRRMLLKHCESEDALPEVQERIFARFGVTP